MKTSYRFYFYVILQPVKSGRGCVGSPQLCVVVTGSLRNLERCLNERGCGGEARNHHGESVWFSVDVMEVESGYRTATVGVIRYSL